MLKYGSQHIDFFRIATKKLRPFFVIATLVLVFAASFHPSISLKMSAIIAFLTNLLILIFDLKGDLFTRINETNRSIDEIKSVISNGNPLAFKSTIHIAKPPEKLPSFIGTSIEGCLAPTYRDSLNLEKLASVREYCDFLNTDRGKNYPPILVCTGRSQGYVEFLAQALGLTESRVEVPFIIEMGTALYYPKSRITEPLISPGEQSDMRKIELILKKADAFKNVVFEPKSFIVTMNPAQTETVGELFYRVTSFLSGKLFFSKINIIQGNTAVDIIPKSVDRLAALKQIVEEHSNGKQSLESMVSVVESNVDTAIIDHVREAYCSESEATFDVEKRVKERFGSEHILESRDVDVFLTVLERSCGITIQ